MSYRWPPFEAFSHTKKNENSTTSEVYFPHSHLYCLYGKVYTLADKSGNVFYVGCTTMTVEQRLCQHISEAKRNSKGTNTRKNLIISKLNYEIVATIVDMVWLTSSRSRLSGQRINKIEKKWIEKYVALGYELCNRDVYKKRQLASKKEFVGQVYSTKGDKIIIQSEALNNS
jgi:GIY-YIG catalytic domain